MRDMGRAKNLEKWTKKKYNEKMPKFLYKKVKSSLEAIVIELVNFFGEWNNKV